MTDQVHSSKAPIFPLVGVPTFLRAPSPPDLDALDADIAIIGVPSDEGSPFLPGTRLAPRSIREHSLRLCAGGAGYYDPETGATFLEAEMRSTALSTLAMRPFFPPTSSTRLITLLR